MGLINALLGEPCRRCQTRMRKKQQFCPSCGSPGTKSEFACWKCNGRNRGGQNHCAHCGAEMFDPAGRFVQRALMVDRTWARGTGDFAARLHVQDVKGLFVKWVVVEEGTAALVFQDGKYAGSVGPGRYDHTSLGQRIATWFNLDVPAVFVLVDVGEVRLRLDAECLTSESLPVQVSAEVFVALSDPLPFYQNLMRGQVSIGVEDFEGLIETDVEGALQAVVRCEPLRSLPGNVKLRDAIMGAVDRMARPTLERYGFTLRHIAAISLESKELEAVVGRAREVFEAQAEANRIRGVEVAKEAAWEATQKDDQRRRERDVADERHGVAKQAVGDDYKRDKDRRDMEAQQDLLKRQREGDVDAWRKKQEADLEMKKAKLALYAAAPPAALAAILDGDEFGRVMRLEELRSQEKMSPEQMLIFVAGKSPDVAKALAQKYVAEGALKQAQVEKLLAEQKAESAGRMADRMGDALVGRAGAACPKCGRGFTTAFCPYCGTARA
ncbi:MAG: hypothetical protein HYY17_11470 [Planctomycetes bacterium]|nr:hypothetical protein [Planctomycetota bacterium]